MESWTRLLLPLALLVWSSGAVWAQSNTARLVGTVKDSSGAVLPGVSIQASSLETGLSRTVTTNDLGDYVITNLPVGRYEVTAELSGFKRLKQGPLQLLVNQTARTDLTLEIGEISETVTAESTVPIIDTETNTLGSVIDETQMKEIPLNGRNFIQLGHLVPGTTTGPPAATTVRTRQGGVSLTANGQRQDQNNWLLDGVDNNAQFFGMVVIVPSVDAIREFKVQTSNYSAEFGRSAGAVVSLETKSGTNRFSGTAYEFLRNDVLDAAEFFAARDAAGQKIKAPLTFNQFGASFGGPILKDRTFFFANYEGKRVRRGKTVGSFVPTAAMREGNYAGLPTLYDPLTYTAATGLRQPFPDNRIPANRIFPASKAMLPYIPEPNNADPSRNFVRVVSDRDDGNQYHLRGDHRFSSKQWITGRFSYYDTDNVTGFAFPLDADVLLNRHRSVVFQHTYALSPRLINEFRLGGTRYHFIYNHETAGEPYTEKFGLPSAAPNSQIDGFPDTRITGLARLGGNAAVPLDRIENTINLIDNINWVQGNHSVKIGGEIRSYRTKNYQPQWGRGRYTFTGVFTAQAGGRYSDGFADFLLGFPAGQNLLNTTGLDAQRPQNWRQTLYLQDDWKIWPRLTLNIGLRYERDGAWTDAHDRTALFDATRGEVVYARDWDISIPIPFPHRFGDSNNIVDTTHGWAPRAGFAWSPFGSSFVIRGGYGVFWSLNTAQSMINTGFIPPGLIQDLQTSGSIVPSIIFGQSAFGSDPSRLLPEQPSFTALPFGLRKNPYTQQWNLTVEKELGRSTMISVAYVGNHTVHLESGYQGNPALPPRAGALQPRRVWPAFGALQFQDSDAFSNYQALQVKTERRFGNGLGFLGAYTWSKSLDNNGGEAESSGGGYQNPLDRLSAKGLSGFDLRHRFTFSPVYELPFGRGRQFLSQANSLVNGFLGGWQMTGIVTLQTGFPFTPIVGGDLPNAGAGTVHPNLTGDNNGNLESGRTIDRWFNTSAFVAPAAFTFGNAGRNTLSGPGLQKVDFGIMKTFRIYEEQTLQFRAEFFNVFNHTNFLFPGMTVGAADFGVIRTSLEPRDIQFALRYSF